MSDTVLRLNRGLEGHYRIVRELGEGGMAYVYLAEDLRHGREVALKVLKPELTAIVGAERFLAEIRTTANLQHPRILPLYDSGEADGFLYYVMPYIAGESLRDRLERDHQLPIAEAVEIATSVASALDFAHRHEVIHRDIKPANILLQDGQPVVADFGIALALTSVGGGRLTETGLSLGTPYYMSPEQATGDSNVGPASDIYALGCVLYEMLVGEPPYTGRTAQAVLGQLIANTAQRARTLRRTVPTHVDAVIAKCLEKIPADRFTKASDFSRALGDPSFRHAEGGLPGRARSLSSAPLTAGLAVLSVMLLVALAAVAYRPMAPQQRAFRAGLTGLEVTTSGDAGGDRLSISRDGSVIVVATQREGVPFLYARDASQSAFREIPGSAGAVNPSISPDGQWVVFQAGTMINRVEIAGGPLLQVGEGSNPEWGHDDRIYFDVGGWLYSVTPSGGTPTPLCCADSLAASRPSLLPNGESVLFQVGAEDAQLKVLDLASGSVTDLGLIGTGARYLPTGHLAYGHSSQAVVVVPFDLRSLTVTGEPFTVQTGVLVMGGGAAQFAVSETGTALFGLGQTRPGIARKIVTVDRAGTATPLRLAPGALSHPRFSPDGRYVAYMVGLDIWVYDRETGSNSALATEGNNFFPIWSPDGRYVYYGSNRGSTLNIDGFRRLGDGSGPEEPLFRRAAANYPVDFAPNGVSILVSEFNATRGMDLVIMELGEDSATFTPYLRADWYEVRGEISPDGAFVAYDSNETGDYEVYVRSFPDGTGQVRVSPDGGVEPKWDPSGDALYYRRRRSVLRVEVSRDPGLSVAPPREVMRDEWMIYEGGLAHSTWDVHPSGGLFVFATDPVGAGQLPTDIDIPVEVVVNWYEELSRRVTN